MLTRTSRLTVHGAKNARDGRHLPLECHGASEGRGHDREALLPDGDLPQDGVADLDAGRMIRDLSADRSV